MNLKEDPLFFLFGEVNTVIVYVASDSFFGQNQAKQIKLILRSQNKQNH